MTALHNLGTRVEDAAVELMTTACFLGVAVGGLGLLLGEVAERRGGEA